LLAEPAVVGLVDGEVEPPAADEVAAAEAPEPFGEAECVAEVQPATSRQASPSTPKFLADMCNPSANRVRRRIGASPR
jgi:hypothetical protein